MARGLSLLKATNTNYDIWSVNGSSVPRVLPFAHSPGVVTWYIFPVVRVYSTIYFFISPLRCNAY